METLDDKIPAADTRNRETMRCWMPLWVQNAVANRVSPLIGDPAVHSLDELRGAHAGRPAIVLGGGPSLDDSLDHGADDILRNRGEAVLVAPQSTLRPLAARGIVPDYVAAMHPTPDIIQDLNMAPMDRPSIRYPSGGKRLVCAVTIHPTIIECWLNHGPDPDDGGGKGDVYLTLQGYVQDLDIVTHIDEERQEVKINRVNTHDLPGDWYGTAQQALFNPGQRHDRLPDIGYRRLEKVLLELPNQGCVTNYGTMVAGVLGCSPILLLGVDFSFTKRPGTDILRYRCDDWRLVDGVWKRQEPNPERDLFKILQGGALLHEADDLAGGKAFCWECMVAYRNSMYFLASHVKGLDEKPLDIVNCSSAGILKDLPRMALAEALLLCSGGHWQKGGAR